VWNVWKMVCTQLVTCSADFCLVTPHIHNRLALTHFPLAAAAESMKFNAE